MPRLSVVIRYAAQNHRVSGVFVLCRIVPAVSETWCRQAAHSQRRVPHHRVGALVPTARAPKPFRPPTPGQVLLTGLLGRELTLKLAADFAETAAAARRLHYNWWPAETTG